MFEHKISLENKANSIDNYTDDKLSDNAIEPENLNKKQKTQVIYGPQYHNEHVIFQHCFPFVLWFVVLENDRLIKCKIKKRAYNTCRSRRYKQ